MSISPKGRETDTYGRGADGALYLIPADGVPARRIDGDHAELRSGGPLFQYRGAVDAKSSAMTIVPDDGYASAMTIVPESVASSPLTVVADDADAAAMTIVPDDAASSAMTIVPDDAAQLASWSDKA